MAVWWAWPGKDLECLVSQVFRKIVASGFAKVFHLLGKGSGNISECPGQRAFLKPPLRITTRLRIAGSRVIF